MPANAGDALQCERAETLDDLLSRWYHWQASYTPVRAWPGRALVVGDYHAGRHWDSGADDDDAIERLTMRAVDSAIERLPAQERIAIRFEARNLAVGSTVFIAVRLPADRAEREEVLCRARSMLVRLLEQMGLM